MCPKTPAGGEWVRARLLPAAAHATMTRAASLLARAVGACRRDGAIAASQRTSWLRLRLRLRRRTDRETSCPLYRPASVVGGRNGDYFVA